MVRYLQGARLRTYVWLTYCVLSLLTCVTSVGPRLHAAPLLSAPTTDTGVHNMNAGTVDLCIHDSAPRCPHISCGGGLGLGTSWLNSTPPPTPLAGGGGGGNMWDTLSSDPPSYKCLQRWTGKLKCDRVYGWTGKV